MAFINAYLDIDSLYPTIEYIKGVDLEISTLERGSGYGAIITALYNLREFGKRIEGRSFEKMSEEILTNASTAIASAYLYGFEGLAGDMRIQQATNLPDGYGGYSIEVSWIDSERLRVLKHLIIPTHNIDRDSTILDIPIERYCFTSVSQSRRVSTGESVDLYSRIVAGHVIAAIKESGADSFYNQPTNRSTAAWPLDFIRMTTDGCIYQCQAFNENYPAKIYPLGDNSGVIIEVDSHHIYVNPTTGELWELNLPTYPSDNSLNITATDNIPGLRPGEYSINLLERRKHISPMEVVSHLTLVAGADVTSIQMLGQWIPDGKSAWLHGVSPSRVNTASTAIFRSRVRQCVDELQCLLNNTPVMEG
jgi:hypothetical protein